MNRISKLIEDGKYRPKYPDSPFVHVVHVPDLVNQETGKTYREENAELEHNIPIGALVEDVDTGVRLYVMEHTRDCDQTPLYSLGTDRDDLEPNAPEWLTQNWHHGYSEDGLKIIKRP